MGLPNTHNENEGNKEIERRRKEREKKKFNHEMESSQDVIQWF